MAMRKPGSTNQRLAQEEFGRVLFERAISRHVFRILFMALIIAALYLGQRQATTLMPVGLILFSYWSVESASQARREAELRERVASRDEVSDDYIRYKYRASRQTPLMLERVEPVLWTACFFLQVFVRLFPFLLK